ncbi:MAG: ABC transporter permease [Bacteroidetes bacterium]|nr:ABC transporter permease [Bacteroidota bacterium]
MVATEAVMANKLRSLLTALGIIFGVAAVIIMMSIISGANIKIMEQLKRAGINNIMIQAIFEFEENQDPANQGKELVKFSPGLTLEDVNTIETLIPSVKQVSPEIIVERFATRKGIGKSAKLVGVTSNFFDIFNYQLSSGNYFSHEQLRMGKPVCLISKGIKTKFFSQENPLNKQIKCGAIWLTVIGVMEEPFYNPNDELIKGLRDQKMDIYVPIKTALLRFKDRSLVTAALIKRASNTNNDNEEEEIKQSRNYHQIDRLVVQVNETEQLRSTTEILSRMLERRHNNVVDFEIHTPELQLRQQQETKAIFNVVLGAIAMISLLVGGIGIMNIMLASVMERIKEIGVRMTVGATKKDIVSQFLFEAIFISISGGIIGVILGITVAVIMPLIDKFENIQTVITFSSILLSFGVAVSIGLIFGLMPAKKAANQDPIQSLRYE